MLSTIKLWAIFMIRILLKSPILFLRIVREYCIVRFLLNKNKIISVNFNWIILHWPNEHWFFYTAIEVFYWQLYIKLKWCNHIIDLWWYLGESAVWLSLYNNKVTVVEPNPSNFYYLNENIRYYKNIYAIEWAIIYQEQWQLYHSGWNFSAWGKITTKKTDIPIENISIDTIRTNDIDWLKMDIEWWEYDIINFLQTNSWLQLKKWYIEFHKIIDNNDIILRYISFLWYHQYNIEYEDIYWEKIGQKKFLWSDIAVLYFIKKT